MEKVRTFCKGYHIYHMNSGIRVSMLYGNALIINDTNDKCVHAFISDGKRISSDLEEHVYTNCNLAQALKLARQ